jgi:predicted Na+-dependent transporter
MITFGFGIDRFFKYLDKTQTGVGNNPLLLFKSLVSVIILFPLVVAVVLLTLQPAEGTVIGLVLLAASPAPPLLTKRALLAGGNVKFAASLQVIFSLLAVGVTPLILFLFSPILPMEGESVNFLLIAKQVATVQLLPLSIGLVIRKISADLGEEIGNLLFNVAETLFIVFVILLLCVSLNIVPLAGSATFMAIAVIVPLGLIIGHVLGGVEDNLDTRSTLATATIARNLGLALFIAIVDGATSAIPCIISYGVLGAVFALPYNVWVKKQMKIMCQSN